MELQDKQERRNAYIQSLLEKCKTEADTFATLRLYGIGGSDMAAILGRSKWHTAYDIWKVKTFRQNVGEEKLCFDTGHALEEVVAKWYEKTTGYVVYEADHLQMQGYPFLIGNFDRLVYDKTIEDGGKIIGGLECKTANENTKIIVDGEERSKWGKDNVEYMAQVQFYMMVSGLEWWDVAVMIGNRELRYYRVHADRELQQEILNKAVSFWNDNVLNDVAPALTMNDARSLQVDDNTATADESIMSLVNKRKDIVVKQKAIEEELKLVEDELAEKIKDYTKVTYTNDEGKVKTLLTFKKDFLKTTTSSRVLRFY